MYNIHLLPISVKIRKQKTIGFESLRPKYCIRLTFDFNLRLQICTLGNMRTTLIKMNFQRVFFKDFHRTLSLVLCRTAIFKNISLEDFQSLLLSVAEVGTGRISTK